MSRGFRFLHRLDHFLRGSEESKRMGRCQRHLGHDALWVWSPETGPGHVQKQFKTTIFLYLLTCWWQLDVIGCNEKMWLRSFPNMSNLCCKQPAKFIDSLTPRIKPLQGGAPFTIATPFTIAKLVNITPIVLWFRIPITSYNYSFHGVYKLMYNGRVPRIVSSRSSLIKSHDIPLNPSKYCEISKNLYNINFNPMKSYTSLEWFARGWCSSTRSLARLVEQPTGRDVHPITVWKHGVWGGAPCRYLQ